MSFHENNPLRDLISSRRKLGHDIIIIAEKTRSETRIQRLNNIIIQLKGERSFIKTEINSVTKLQLEYQEGLEYVLRREEDMERIQEAIDIIHNIAKNEYLEAINKTKGTILL